MSCISEFVTLKSAMGENGQIQFGTVAGGSAHEMVSDDLPGACAFGAPLGLADPALHPISETDAAAMSTPGIRSRRHAPEEWTFMLSLPA
jgi:hypothetical protein